MSGLQEDRAIVAMGKLCIRLVTRMGHQVGQEATMADWQVQQKSKSEHKDSSILSNSKRLRRAAGPCGHEISSLVRGDPVIPVSHKGDRRRFDIWRRRIGGTVSRQPGRPIRQTPSVRPGRRRQESRSVLHTLN